MSHRLPPAIEDVGRDDDTISQASSAHPSKRTPGYAAPTTAQQLPEYANAEAEAIRASFSTGNYRLIAHLPTELKPHHVSEATANRIDDNITSAYFVAPHGTYRKFGQKDALFSTFDYAPSEYSLASKLLTEERKQKEEMRLKVNPLPFLYSTPRPLLTNSLAGAPSYEENLQHAGKDVYESSEDQQRRLAYLDSQKMLHGPFIPSHGSRSIGDDKIIRMKLPDIIQKLMKELDADWGDTSFQIYSDEEDLIIIQFDVSTVDNPKGLLAYMNMFVKTNKVVSEYALSKLVELWNHSGADGFLYYSFRPPWVHRRIEESLFVLHPEMAAKGGRFIGDSKEKQARLKGEGEKEQKEELQQTQPDLLRLTSGSSAHNQPVVALAGNPPPATLAYTHGGSGSAGKMSSEDREQIASLMASFDAGLSVRRDQPSISSRSSANAK